MTRIALYALVVLGCVAVVFGYLTKIKIDAANAEREKIHIELAADTNQKIGARRAIDATFDKDDARAFCERVKLTWVFADGKSHCE